MATGATTSSYSAKDKKKNGHDGPQVFSDIGDEIKLCAACKGKKLEEDRQMSKDEIRKLVDSMEKQVILKSLLQSDSCYIYRVPRPVHMTKPEAYTPQVISIGPLHHGKLEHLLMMEKHKWRYLDRLLDRNPSSNKRTTLENCVKGVSDLEEKARNCYLETIDLKKEEFVKMMVLDGCFIIEFFEMFALREKKDLFHSHTSWYWEIVYDLFKLENQLPFFVIKHLHALIFQHCSSYNFRQSGFVYYLCYFASMLPDTIVDWEEKIKSLPLDEAKHLLDVLRYVQVPASQLPSSLTSGKLGEAFFPLTYCASELRSAGVKFQKEKSDSTKTSSSSFFDIHFDMEKGVLTIPTLEIVDGTETILRNLTASEQGQYRLDNFTSYAFFMDGLIDTATDVELLEHKGIIKNGLGSPDHVVTLFNSIGRGLFPENPIFFSVIKDLEEYRNKTWNKRKANLMQNYFNTPWASISVAAAVLLIILTTIQTICSILQVIH